MQKNAPMQIGAFLLWLFWGLLLEPSTQFLCFEQVHQFF